MRVSKFFSVEIRRREKKIFSFESCKVQKRYCTTLKINTFLLIFIFSQNQSEITKTERLAKDAEQKRIQRSKETTEEYFSRTDKNAARMALKRAEVDEILQARNTIYRTLKWLLLRL